MKTKDSAPSGKSLIYKGVLIAIIGVCLVLGVIGLILPIIPGLLFLALAVMLASKLSRRVAVWASKAPLLKGWTKHSHTIGGLSRVQRLKLAFWVSAKYTVNSLSAMADRLNPGSKAQ